MTQGAIDTGNPHHLVAVDLAALGPPDFGSWLRLGDRLDRIRRELVLVFIGGTEFPGLPEPDYVIEQEGAEILRNPGLTAVEEWPPPGQPADVEAAIDHLAASLLVPHSEVYCVLGIDQPLPEELERLVVIGGNQEPPRGFWVREAAQDSIIGALEQAQLLGRTTAAAPDVGRKAFEAAIESVRRNVIDLGFTAASIADNPLSAHDANYASVWARDGVITGLWTLCLEDPELLKAFESTLRLLAKHQAPSGQIPSNVRLDGEGGGFDALRCL